MSATGRLDDDLDQDGWSVQPTHNEGEWLLSHDGIHVRIHEARLVDSDGVDYASLRRHSKRGTTTVAEVSLPDAPWRIEAWLRELVAATSGVEA